MVVSSTLLYTLGLSIMLAFDAEVYTSFISLGFFGMFTLYARDCCPEYIVGILGLLLHGISFLILREVQS